MQQRKLIQHGLSSLTVSLPAKWLKERKLQKGDPLFVEEEGNKIILSTKQPKNIEKISVNIGGLDRTSALLYIQSLYRFGYNEIEIKFKKPTTIHYRTKKRVRYSSVVHYIVTRCIGAEIVEQQDDRIVIRYITKEAEEDFRLVLRRIFHLINETSSGLIEGIETHNTTKLETIEEKHDMINNFVSYCLRLLNKYGYPDVKKTCFYYHVIASLDKVVDVFKYTARDIIQHNKKLHKESIKIFRDIHNSVELYSKLFYKFNSKTIDELGRNRDFVKFQLEEKKSKLPSHDVVNITRMIQILEIILDLTDARMGLEY